MSYLLSNIKPEVVAISVLHNIFLAFKPPDTFSLGRRFTAAADLILIGNDLGPDKALFKIGVDDAGRLLVSGAFADGPGPCFLFAHGEEVDKAKQAVAGLDQLAEVRALKMVDLPTLGSPTIPQRKPIVTSPSSIN
jgi:hypothetical protein